MQSVGNLVITKPSDLSDGVSSRTGHVKPCLNPEGPPSKAKYVLRSIVDKYREGKVKSTPDRGMK
jgi:hypothetical protein